jgi:hypothetical protein
MGGEPDPTFVLVWIPIGLDENSLIKKPLNWTSLPTFDLRTLGKVYGIKYNFVKN